MINNPIGHTIFLTSENYRMTNFFSQVRKISPFECECLQRYLLVQASRFADINSVKQFIEDQQKGKYKKENSTECCFYLSNF